MLGPNRPPEKEAVERRHRREVAIEEAGARAKVSSIHVNGWFGTYDKLGMTRTLMHECFGIDLDAGRGASDACGEMV